MFGGPRPGQATPLRSVPCGLAGLTGHGNYVMAALVTDGDAQPENERDERDAQGRENSQEVTARVLSRAAIRRKCAFTYMNAVSRKNLTDARAVNANDVRTALDTGAAFGGVTGSAPSRRMIVTCMWGVSDPLRAGRGAKKAAAKWGSLTPHCAPCSAATAARTAKPAAQNAAGVRPEAADWQEHRTSFVLHKAKRAVGSASESVSGRGNGAPEFRFPHPVPPLESRHGPPWSAKAAA